MSARSASNSSPSAPKTARRMALRVMRIIGASVGNSAPCGQVAASRSVSSAMIAS